MNLSRSFSLRNSDFLGLQMKRHTANPLLPLFAVASVLAQPLQQSGIPYSLSPALNSVVILPSQSATLAQYSSFPAGFQQQQQQQQQQQAQQATPLLNMYSQVLNTQAGAAASIYPQRNNIAQQPPPANTAASSVYPQVSAVAGQYSVDAGLRVLNLQPQNTEVFRASLFVFLCFEKKARIHHSSFSIFLS